MSNIWFTSDTHMGHTNIAGPKVSKWSSGYRIFDSVHDMNKALTEGINKYVKPGDILYHLGDWSFGGIENIYKFRRRIICENIHLILGNHDSHIARNSEIKTEDGFIKPRDLFTSVRDVSRIKHGQNEFFLSHYSHRVWDKSHRGVIHLYGHSHGSIPDFGKSMDVGVDVAYRLFGEYRPFHINEILDIMKDRDMAFVDNHMSE